MTTSADATDEPRRPISARVWLAPVVVATLLMALLGTAYLAYVIDPQQNLHDFPIALVNSDDGDTVAGKPANFGKQITDALVKGIPADKVDLQVTGISEARAGLRTGKLYGAILIPSDFTKRLANLGAAAVIPGDVEHPIITVQTNPRMGTYATSILQRITNQALSQVNTTVGKQLTEQVHNAIGEKGPALTGASRLTLAQPVEIVTAAYHPLPDHTGQGLTAFFYTVMLLLAGFTGAMVVHTMVDSMLGFAPTEFGPWYMYFPATPLSRFRTLLLKWGIMIVLANVVSGVYMGIGAALGMPIDYPLALFLYSAFAIIAVGFTALAVLAAIGTVGLLVNMILFIILGLPSSGGTVPIEASPKIIGWLAEFEPMHQVFIGLRAILYLDSGADAGLSQACWMTLLGLVIGLALGIVVTRIYDRKGLHRKPAEVTSAM